MHQSLSKIRSPFGRVEKTFALFSTSSVANQKPLKTIIGSHDLDEEFQQRLTHYSAFQPSPLSIKEYLEFGQNSGSKQSFRFLRREVPVRLANIMKELQFLPKDLQGTQGCREITDQYVQSFQDLLAFEGASDEADDVLEKFTNVLVDVRERHSATVTTMASAVLEVKAKYSQSGKKEDKKAKLPKFERNIQYFLDRLYTSRISTRMLINQHTLLFGDKVDQGQRSVGAIDPNCSVIPIVERAYENARFLAEQYYMASPELKVRAYDKSCENSKAIPINDELSEEKANVECVYVPSHLYHILFELFKNAMRATIETYPDSYDLPPIRALIVKSKEDVTIKISDRGGGIPRRLKKKIFQYLYTTAPNPVLSVSTDDPMAAQMGQQSVPLAGYGYGLPLSRLYAQYFAGNLQIYSCDGYGTDAVIYLQALARDAKERLPVYHETGSKKIYEAQLAANDWTEYDGSVIKK
ncbi:hypothetical protein TCAL_00193 [Tigriopus californicus]|uniref:Protein-serine/threonine kinase n=1 Tax=Tigriopus californicus TaxID=6832 RepID=A0A553P4B1_TIGCA|nr:pyruvate dehydrogenase (acetyl-transferring) kinase isozyme 2, mitochondrial-like [Tigriopus californicus]TRY72503.1 hypothetical protein TCAL_00193 [Tigriopus californicus]|eukprot:TCALIF_00193-PA protein Name:"Similar to Pdk [Pyruvate dehydrogenase (acetyl-transferring)] kinase, mitochondrial (Drosophila melanogaster)" AED:0.12 eAED:0.12 QI:0/-1/0/1/-1/1/1/0/466